MDISRKGKIFWETMESKAKNASRGKRLKVQGLPLSRLIALPKKFLETVGIDRSRLIHDAVKKVLWEVGAIYEHVPTQD